MIDGTYLQHLCRITLARTPFPLRERAVVLLLGTAATESGFRNIDQVSGGGARGAFQLEQPTARDMDTAFRQRDDFADVLPSRTGLEAFTWDAVRYSLPYQILLARMLYYVRDPEKMPEVLDVEGQATRYKRFYNTAAGAGTEAKYIADWHALVEPLIKRW